MPTSASLRRGDIVSDVILGSTEDKDILRQVKIDKVVDGYTWYLGKRCPVIYVYGTDLDTRKKVGYTRTLHFRWMNVVRASANGLPATA